MNADVQVVRVTEKRDGAASVGGTPVSGWRCISSPIVGVDFQIASSSTPSSVMAAVVTVTAADLVVRSGGTVSCAAARDVWPRRHASSTTVIGALP